MRFLFLIFVIELFVGGGGRLLSFGPVTARMILFSLCLISYFLLFTKKQRHSGLTLASILVGLFFLTHFHAVGFGLLNGKNTELVISEFQQVIFWICAPFIAYMMREPEMVEKISRILVRCAIFLSASYILLLALILSGVVNPIAFYEVSSQSGEFFFRTESLFFYKGFVYIAIGILFTVALQEKHWQLLALVLSLTLVLTLTRGFLLSASIAIILMIWSQRRWGLMYLIACLAVLASVLVFGYLPSLDDSLEANRLDSSNQRLEDMSFILSNIDLSTFLFGQGYGSLINDRQNIENTFLWALWKLGVFGVLFWFVPLLVCSFYYYKIRSAVKSKVAAAYYFGVVLIYLQTATNPYLNNPIGLSYVIISIFALRTLYITLKNDMLEHTITHKSRKPVRQRVRGG